MYNNSDTEVYCAAPYTDDFYYGNQWKYFNVGCARYPMTDVSLNYNAFVPLSLPCIAITHDAVLCTNSRAVLGSLHTLSHHFLITAQYITLRVRTECVSRYLWTILPSAYRS